jgi:uncharacterized protein (DUF4415 family)
MKTRSKQAGEKRVELLRRIRADMAATTPGEDAAVTAAAEADPDNLTNLFPKRMGRPPSAVTKESITLRVDPDVVRRFKADGPGWQSRMNEALRKAVGL